LTGEEKGSFKTLMIGFAQQNSHRIKNGNENAVILKPNLDDIAPLIYEVADSRFYEFISWVGHKLAPEKVRSLEQRTKNRTQINQIFEIISKITGDDIRLSEDALDATVVNTANPNGLPLELMSQGYQNVVGWVGFFMKRLWEYGQMELPDADFTKMPAICLIDEIDTYLHPDWQYRILSVLVDHFKNVQFIVTSHSPFVLSSIPKDKILLYELLDDGGEIVVRQETENLFGAEMNEMAREMGTTKRFKKIDEQVEKMFELIQANKLTDADQPQENAEQLLASLEKEINPNTSDLIKAENLIKTKKFLRQRTPKN
jgi:predicted ATP-binding protein involved in virulence